MILLTGGSGFIGSNIIEKFNSQGISDIVVADELDASLKLENLYNKRIIDIIDKNVLFDNISKYNFDTVIHMGACTDTTEKDSKKMLQNNFDFSKKLFKHCTNYNLKFIYASSASVYGDGSLGFSEDIDLNSVTPLNLYAFSKLLFDRFVEVQKSYPDNWCGLRFFNCYGPNEFHKGKMASMVYRAYLQIKKDGKVYLFKDNNDNSLNGEQKRDFVYVKDVADVIMHLYNMPKFLNGIYNLGSGIANSFNNIAKAVFTAMNLKVDIEYINMPASIQSKYQSFTKADINKLRNIGYSKEFTSITNGIGEYITFLETKM